MGIFFWGASFIVIVAVPIIVVTLPVLEMLVMLRSDIMCLCADIPSNFTIVNFAVNLASEIAVPLLLAADGLITISLHVPEDIHAGFPSTSF